MRPLVVPFIVAGVRGVAVSVAFTVGDFRGETSVARLPQRDPSPRVHCSRPYLLLYFSRALARVAGACIFFASSLFWTAESGWLGMVVWT